MPSLARLVLTQPFTSGYHHYVLKFRSQVMELSDWLAESFPEAKTLFFYRNALSWLNSFLRSLLRDLVFDQTTNRIWEQRLAQCYSLVVEYQRAERAMSPAVLRTLGWVSPMDHFLALQEQGVEGLTSAP